MNPTELGTFGELDEEMSVAIAIADSTPTSNKPRLEGVGLYLELTNDKNNQTTQILITPQGKTEKGDDVDFAVIYRTVSEWSPRKQWRTNFSRLSAEAKAMSAQDQALKMSDTAEGLLKRQVMYGMTLVKQPIAFELTDIDFTDISQWKAPASALRRIQKARVSLGMPEKLVK
jgi:hypothetical protein